MTFECIHNALSVCSIYMDGALVTFDGARNKIYGVAQYIVSEQKPGDFCKPVFKVSMSTENNGNLTSLVTMYLMFEKQDGSMIEIETTSEGKSFFYHNKTEWRRLYPQISEDFVFEKTGRKHYIKTWSGIEYIHVERRFELRLPAAYDDDLRMRFLLLKRTYYIKYKFSKSNHINRYRRGLETRPQAKTSKSGHAIFFSFFSNAFERRV